MCILSFSCRLLNKNQQGRLLFTNINFGGFFFSWIMYEMFFLFSGFSINDYLMPAVCVWCGTFLRECQCLGQPSVVACYVNCHWGEVGVVTLLAPGRRWSLTYGSASPLESMAFSPCGHKQTHTCTVVSKVTSSCPQTRHTADRVRKKEGECVRPPLQ